MGHRHVACKRPDSKTQVNNWHICGTISASVTMANQQHDQTTLDYDNEMTSAPHHSSAMVHGNHPLLAPYRSWLCLIVCRRHTLRSYLEVCRGYRWPLGNVCGRLLSPVATRHDTKKTDQSGYGKSTSSEAAIALKASLGPAGRSSEYLGKGIRLSRTLTLYCDTKNHTGRVCITSNMIHECDSVGRTSAMFYPLEDFEP